VGAAAVLFGAPNPSPVPPSKPVAGAAVFGVLVAKLGATAAVGCAKKPPKTGGAAEVAIVVAEVDTGFVA